MYANESNKMSQEGSPSQVLWSLSLAREGVYKIYHHCHQLALYSS